MEQEIENVIYCPLSKQIFMDPVIAGDGHTYERFEILKWFRISDTSPITQIIINKLLIPNYSIKTLVNQYLILNNNKTDDQYSVILSFQKNKTQVTNAICNNSFNELLKYDDFSLNYFIKDLNMSLMEVILKKCQNDEVSKHIIKNSKHDIADYNNWNLIHYVCAYGSLSMINYCHNMNIDNIELTLKDGYTPFLLAIKYNPNVGVIDYFVENVCGLNKTIKINTRDIVIHISPLYVACIERRDIKFVKRLLEHDFQINDNYLNLEGHYKSNLINRVCKINGTRDIIQILFEHGADTLEKDEKYDTPLQLICKHQSLDTIEYFIDYYINNCVYPKEYQLCSHGLYHCPMYYIQDRFGNKIAKKMYLKPINLGQDCLYCTSCHFVKINNIDMIEYIINLNLIDFKSQILNKKFAIHHIIQYFGVNFLKKYIIRLDINNLDNNGDSVLHSAIMYSDDDMFYYLVNEGADINAKNNHGVTVMYSAIAYKKYNIIEYLLDNELLDIHDKSFKNRNYLHCAVCYNVEIIDELFIRGLDINDIDDDGLRPIHFAIDRRTPFCLIKKLIEIYCVHLDIQTNDSDDIMSYMCRHLNYVSDKNINYMINILTSKNIMINWNNKINICNNEKTIIELIDKKLN